MERKDLEAKLRAIQDLKAKKYIGTQQAWEYLRDVESIYEKPRKIADDINKNLQERLGEEIIYYPATEERVFGIVEILSKLAYDAISKDFEYSNTDVDYNLDDDEEFKAAIKDKEGKYEKHYKKFIGHPLQQLEFALTSESATTDIMALIYQIFYETQYEGINNLEFGQKAVEIAFKDYPLSHKEEVLEKINQDISILDWYYVLSREALRKERIKICQDYLQIRFGLDERVKIIKRDKIDHRLERRREVLADFLSTYAEEFTTDSYESVLEYLNFKMTIMAGLCMAFGKKSIKNPELDALLYVKEVLVRERNFVERYLRQGKK